jgi:hypothetical protein
MPQVISVMIDNHPGARPQAGLAKASIVYEVPVEGEFTRYFALYNASTTVDKVGPVRSARPYFLDWLQEYGDAVYMHSGGSPEALQLLKNSAMFDANEFFRGAYFWRGTTHAAPHNLYTSSSIWGKLLSDYGFNRTPISWKGWKFSSSSEKMTTSSSSQTYNVSITYLPGYKVTWEYQATSGTFGRLLNDEVYRDESGSIMANNVVIQYVKIETTDDEGRKHITTVGEGEALVLIPSKLIRGTWKKGSVTERTRWYDQNGNEIPLNPGVTWVEVMPLTGKVVVTSSN